MKASDFNAKLPGVTPGERKDPLAMYVEKHPERLNDLDKHWSEVMKLAEKYGFINQAVGGTAILATHRAILDYEGPCRVADVMRMDNIELPEGWEIQEVDV